MKAKVKWIFSCLGISFLALIIQADLGVGAGGSQYLIHVRGNTSGQDEIKIFNPSAVEMFVLYLEYNSDFSFSECDAGVYAAKSTSFGGGNTQTGSPLGSVSSRTYNELIAVPTTGKVAGAISLQFGVLATMGSGSRDGENRFPGPSFVSQTPNKFKVLSPAAATCACGELSSFGLPSNLLRNFRIRCP
jgi:hypothetical protein